MTQITSFRLSQGHRHDIRNSVMSNWENQNPAPQFSTKHLDDLIKKVIQLYKKSSGFKDHQKISQADFTHDLKQQIIRTTGSRELLVSLTNKQGEKRTTAGLVITCTTAERLNFPADLLGCTRDSLLRCAEDGTYRINGDYLDMAKVPVEDAEKYIQENYTQGLDHFKQNHESINIPCLTFFTPGILSMPEDASTYSSEKRAFNQEYNAWHKEFAVVSSEVLDTLNQFNTSKQLLEGWPDIAGYMPPHLVSTDAINLPVLAINRLNERLGLL